MRARAMCLSLCTLSAAPVLAAGDRAQPVVATVLVASQSKSSLGFHLAAGVIINSDGLVVTNHRSIANANQVWVFLYAADARGQEDSMAYLSAHYRDAIKATVRRSDPGSDLALLALPPRGGGYPAVEFADSTQVHEGDLVIALGKEGDSLLWSGATTGTVSEVRSDALVNSASSSVCTQGGPVLDSAGRLLGITVAPTDSPCVARPANQVRAFASGDHVVGAAGAPGNGALLTEVVQQLTDKLGRPQAARALAALWTAGGVGGRVAVRVPGPAVAELMNGAIAAVARAGRERHAELGALVRERLPRMVTGSDGSCAVLRDLKYIKVDPATLGGPPLAAAVDDRDGALFLVDASGRLLGYDRQWRPLGLTQVLDVAASNGTVYALLASGKLMQRGAGGRFAEIQQSPMSGTLLASGGVLYALGAKGELSRYRDGKWEGGLASGLRQVVAAGPSWFGLTQAGRVQSSDKARFTELGEGAVALAQGGDTLVMVTRNHHVFEYDLKRARWTSLPF